MACPILEIEDQQNESLSKSGEAIDKLHSVDTTLNIIDTIKKYGDNLADPKFKEEVQDILERHQNESSSDKLTRANQQIYNNTGLERQTKEYKLAMDKALRDANATGNLPGMLGAVTTFLNKQFKSYSVSLALGRFINESAQAGTLAFTNKVSQLASSPFRKERFASMLGLTEDRMPSPGKITGESFATREFTQEGGLFGGKPKEESETLKMLDKPAELLRKLNGSLLDKTVGRIEQFFYETEFYRSMGDYVTKNGKEASSFLFKDENLTPQNKAKKEKLIQQWKREARDSTKQAFFDYSSNPLILNKLETYIPFTNFMYNGIKLLQKYPATFLFGATVLNNMQNAYGQEVSYIDDDGQAIDAGQSLRVSILASLGLDSVALNMNRMMQITPGSLGLKPLPIFNYIFGREDPRFKKFYKSGTYQDYADLALSMVSTPIQTAYNALVNWNKNKDLNGKSQNSLADLNETISYLSTGVVLKDKSTSKAWDLYIKKDYDALLAMSPNQIQRFLQQDTLAKKGVTLNSLKALKKANDMKLFDFVDDPYSQAVLTLGALPLHESVQSMEQVNTDGEIIKNLTETALGKHFTDKNYEESFDTVLAKWEDFYNDRNFRDFEKVMPGYASTIKHFVENKSYYSDRADAYAMRKSDDENKRIDGELKLIALNYRFKGDEGMTVNEKVNAIKYGKLNTPLFYGDSKDGIPAHSVMMTDAYLATLDHKGQAVASYMEKTNGISALNQARKVFSQLAYAANTKSEKQKYFDMSKKMYMMSLEAEHELKVSGTPEYQLFMLSPDYQKFKEYTDKKQDKGNYSYTTNWYGKYKDNRNMVIANTKASRDAQQKALINKLNSLTPKEAEFYTKVMNTDPDHRAGTIERMMNEVKGVDTNNEEGYLQKLFRK